MKLIQINYDKASKEIRIKINKFWWEKMILTEEERKKRNIPISFITF